VNGEDRADRMSRPAAPGDGGGEKLEETIERQIESLRSDIGELVSELDRRRHEAFDVRLQLRRHRKALLAVGTGALVLGMIGYRVWAAAKQRRDQPVRRLQNLVRALVLMSEHPDRLARAMEGRAEPGTAAMAALGRIAGAVGQRMIAPAPAAPRASRARV
jgi:hypothetical protein